MLEVAECDHLVKNAAELMAATHVADGHTVGIDHADRLGSWLRLADLAQAVQSIQSIHAARRTDHVDSCYRSTSTKLEADSGGVWSPELLYRVRRRTAAMARAIVAHSAAA